MQAVSLGYGKVNFEHQSASFAAFSITEPWLRVFPSKMAGSQRRGRLQSFPATQHPDINGTLFLDTVEAPEGSVLLMQGQYRSHALPLRDAGVFIRLREQGPMLTVSANLPQGRDSLLGSSFLLFQGRGDLLGIEELAEYKIVPPRSWVEAFMQGDEIEASFQIHELQAEIAPRPKTEVVTNLSGKQVAITSAAPSRRVKVR